MINQTSNSQSSVQLDPNILAIVKGLALTENGGKIPNQANEQAGQSGETKSVFQFLPDTWKLYAGQTLGNKNAPITPQNESAVVYAKVEKWYEEDSKEGYTPDQITERIASRWNAGEQNPDAYKQNYKGTNKEGINYNTPKYAKNVLAYSKKSGENSSVDTSATKNTQNVGGQVVMGNTGIMNTPSPTLPQATLKPQNGSQGLQPQKGIVGLLPPKIKSATTA